MIVNNVKAIFDFYSPESAVEQTGQDESHEAREEEELVAHVERYDLVDFRYVSQRSRVAIGVHREYDHADDPRQTEEEYHQRYSQPQSPRQTLRIWILMT